jgi:choline dehydrogenase-like flavoprotein
LWASKVRPDALGRYLNDQPQVIGAVALNLPAADRLKAGTGDGRDALTGVLWIPFDESTDFPFHGQIMQVDASPIDLGQETWDDSRPRVGIGLFTAKEARYEDRVWFDDSQLDESGLPAIHIDYGLTERDAERIARAIRLAGQLAESLGDIVPEGTPKLLPAGSSLHYQGSVRMGTDPATSVCDANGEVWGFPGLFVAGNGVIPTETACNPTLTSVALAIHTAAAIAGRTSDDAVSPSAPGGRA